VSQLFRRILDMNSQAQQAVADFRQRRTERMHLLHEEEEAQLAAVRDLFRRRREQEEARQVSILSREISSLDPGLGLPHSVTGAGYSVIDLCLVGDWSSEPAMLDAGHGAPSQHGTHCSSAASRTTDGGLRPAARLAGVSVADENEPFEDSMLRSSLGYNQPSAEQQWLPALTPPPTTANNPSMPEGSFPVESDSYTPNPFLDTFAIIDPNDAPRICFCADDDFDLQGRQRKCIFCVDDNAGFIEL